MFPYLYKFTMKATCFQTLSYVMTPLFYLKGYNIMYFYKLLVPGRDKGKDVENTNLQEEKGGNETTWTRNIRWTTREIVSQI